MRAHLRQPLPVRLQPDRQRIEHSRRRRRGHRPDAGAHGHKVGRVQRLGKLPRVKRQLMPYHLARRRLKHLHRQLRAGDPGLHRRLHHARRHLVRQTEGQAGLAHKRIGQLGRRHKPFRRLPPQMGLVERQRLEKSGVQRKAFPDRRQRMKQRRQDFIFDVLRVPIRNVVTLGDDRLGIAQGTAEPRTQVLQHDRVALLRHDRADLDKAVVHAQGVGLLGRPHQQVMRHPAQIDRQRLHGKGDVRHEFAAADGMLRALDDARKAEQRRHPLPVDGKAGSRQGRRPQRREVHRRIRPSPACVVVAQKGENPRQVVGERHRLRRLRVGVPRHQCVEMAARLLHHSPAQRQQLLHHRGQPHPQRHARQGVSQVVAAARQLQVATLVRPGQLDDAPLDAKEEVLDARLIGVGVHAVGADRRHGAHDGRGVGAADHTAFGQHERVRFVRLEHRLKQVGLGVAVGRLQHVTAVDRMRKC